MKPGTMIRSKRFAIHKVLGQGGMGVVYQAEDRLTGALVALKSIGEVAGEDLLRFKREFRALADVQHRNLVRLGELFCEDQQWFFTMELVRGRPFLDHVRLRTPIARPSPRPPPATSDDSAEVSDISESIPTATLELPSDAAVPSQPGVTTASLPLAPMPPEETSGSQEVSEPSVPQAGVLEFDELRLRDALGQLGLALVALHEAGCVHGDIKPSNVLVEDGGRVVLLDFGLIRELDRDREAHLSDDRKLVLGTPLYMAPEQAVGAAIGPAADWYAMGVMLYVALTGVTPFSGTSSYMLMRAKLLQTPPPPGALASGLPPDLEALCQDLLQAEPSKRPSDEEVLARLGVSPRSESQRIRQAPFLGRTQELVALQTAFDDLISAPDGNTAAASGAATLSGILIHGESGMGKTALASHFLTVLTRKQPRAAVLAGRCYEQEHVPFRAFDTVIDALAARLHRLSTDTLELVLSEGVQYLAAMFPVLRRVPAIAERVLQSSQLRNTDRRGPAFEELRAILRALAADAPVVMFIDDLQWADDDSLALLRQLVTPPLIPRMLLIATMRNPAQDTAASWLQHTIGDAAAHVRTLGLGALTPRQAQALLETLWETNTPAALAELNDTERLRRITRIVDEAGGHPLFLTELAQWSGGQRGEDLGEIRLDHVLRQRVAALSPSARRILELSALVGVPVHDTVLSDVAGLDEDEGEQAFAELRAGHLLRVVRRHERRLLEPYHDRLREALVSDLDAGDKTTLTELHRRIGQSLLQRTRPEDLDSEVFTIAWHLNQAAAVLRDPAERRQLVELNLRAGRLALRATSAQSALPYLLQARSLLAAHDGAPEDISPEHQGLARTADRELLEAELLGGHRDAGMRRLRSLHQSARTPAQRAELYELEVRLLTALGELPAAVTAGREGLQHLGIFLPRKPNVLSLLWEYFLVQRRLRGRSTLELNELPLLTDERMNLGIRLLMSLSQAAFHIDSFLFSVILLRLMRLSLEYGMSEVSGYAFASYGTILSGAFHKHYEGYQIGEFASRFGERRQLDLYAGRVELMRASIIDIWVRPFAESVALTQKCLEHSRRYGDLQFEGFTSGTFALLDLCMGLELAGSQARVSDALRLAERRQDVEMIGSVGSIARFYAALLGQTRAPTSLARHGEDEAAVEAAVNTDKTPLSACYYSLAQAELHYFARTPGAALGFIDAAARRTQALFGTPTAAEVMCFRGLIAGLQLLDTPAWWPRRRLRGILRGAVRMLRRSARSCAANYEAHYWMVYAMEAYVTGHSDQAMRRLDLAIEAARLYGSVKREAMALELAGQVCRSAGAAERAARYERDAIAAYQRWGARWKAEQLAQAHITAAADP